jgi:serine/threonine protein kinase
MTTAAGASRGGGAGRPVAVKVMDAAGSLQGEREFHNEIAVASHLLASSSAPVSPPVPDAAAKPGGKGRDSILLPFAYSMSSAARGEGRPRRMMLVYDLMPNGSLQDALLGRRCPELVAEWPRRLAVARDVAAALHYLHSVVKPPVVHGDVKPNNVLLDTSSSSRAEAAAARESGCCHSQHLHRSRAAAPRPRLRRSPPSPLPAAVSKSRARKGDPILARPLSHRRWLPAPARRWQRRPSSASCMQRPVGHEVIHQHHHMRIGFVVGMVILSCVML